MKKLITILLIGILGLLVLMPALAEEASPKLVLSEAEIRLATGKNVTLKATVENPPAGKKAKPTWESSDPAVCTVSGSGAVKAVAEGTAVVTCRMELPDGNALTAECRVTTFVAAKALKPVNKDIRLNVGETAMAEYTLQPEDTTEKTFDWSSGNEAVVTVDAAGRLTAVAPGTAKVTAQAKDGSKVKADFSVYVPTLAVAETEYTISELSGLTVPVLYYGEDFDRNVSVKAGGKPVRVTVTHEGNRAELHLDALEAGDSKIEITDKADKKAKTSLTVHTEDGALRDNLLVEFTLARLQWKSRGLLFSFSAVNHSSRKIVAGHVQIDFRNAAGEQIFNLGSTFDGKHDFPILPQTYDLIGNVNPGARYSYKTHLLNSDERYITDRDIAEIRCAINTITFEDGSTLAIPDDQMYWYSTLPDAGYLEQPPLKENVPVPDQETREKAENLEIGYTSAYLFKVTRSWYGISESGPYVTHIEPGSIAEKCGLQLRDLIIEADGIRWADDRNCTTRAIAKVADGETVIFRVLRDGGEVELEIHK